MKLGILAALVAALVAVYFVFGSDFLAPASSDAVTAKGEDMSSAKDGTAGVTSPRVHSADEGSGEPEVGNNNNPSAEPGGEDEAAKGAPGSVPGVKRTLGTTQVYTRHDGTIVRDHRPNPPPPDLDGFVVLPDEVSKVKSNVLVDYLIHREKP